MRMIDRIIRSMQDTGLIDGMTLEDADTLATAALEAMREPDRLMWATMADTVYGYKNRHHDKVVGDIWYAGIDAALNE